MMVMNALKDIPITGSMWLGSLLHLGDKCLLQGTNSISDLGTTTWSGSDDSTVVAAFRGFDGRVVAGGRH